MKRDVYLHEFNVVMEGNIYLPLVCGLLKTYALTVPAVRENYRFMPFLFIREDPEKILVAYGAPAVGAFSVSMWNMNLSLTVARALKERFPDCLIVFGGPHVPFEAGAFFRQYPFIDVAVRGEGEQAFAEILTRNLESRDFGGIPGLSYRGLDGACVRNAAERPFVKDLDVFPSPYLEGAYDDLFARDIGLQAIVETNRGCPYNCSYCFWGKAGLSKRYCLFSLERVKAVAEWCGRRRIRYVFCADANFGTFKRDLTIAEYFVETKRRYGFPEKFRVCYAKESEETVFEIGRLLHEHDMEKSITMARQTNSAQAARNVGRKNIRMEVFNRLQEKYNEAGVPVYTELILGLPGETYASFLEGIEDLLRSGLKNQIFVYLCQVYPNTELAEKGYQERLRVVTVQIPLHETHAAVRPVGTIEEMEEIIVGSFSMTTDDWKKMAVVAWVTQLFHSLKLGFYVMLYLHDRCGVGYAAWLEHVALLKMRPDVAPILTREVATLHEVAAAIAGGAARTRVLPEFGDIYWDPDEAAYLSIVADKGAFFEELAAVTTQYLEAAGLPHDREELAEVVRYQDAVVPHFDDQQTRYSFQYNIPEYFDRYFSKERVALARRPLTMTLAQARDFKGDKKTFAREVVLFGRKSDRMVRRFDWAPAP